MEKALTKGKRVLVVEDEPGISEICELVLGGEGFQVDTAANGSVALNILRRTEYDLCLIDIRTPLMNGIELYQHMEGECPQTVSKVIFTTGDVLNSGVMEFIGKTSRPFLPKPFTVDELKTIVVTALDLNHDAPR